MEAYGLSRIRITIHSFSGPIAARSRLSFRTGDVAGMHLDQGGRKRGVVDHCRL